MPSDPRILTRYLSVVDVAAIPHVVAVPERRDQLLSLGKEVGLVAARGGVESDAAVAEDLQGMDAGRGGNDMERTAPGRGET